MEIRMNVEVSLQEAEDLILAVGNENAIHLVGEPGIGKTAMHERLVARTGYRGVYIDTPNTELGDIGIPMPNHETKTTSLYPNEFWGFHKHEPIVVFIDEFSKPSSQAVQNMLHPLLNERRIGGMRLHPDSIVVTAGNNISDGVGDMLKAHSISRMTITPVRKPYWDEYVDYGTSAGFAPELLAFVRQYPQVMASYKDPTQKENNYIYNPRTPQNSYFCPRSGHRASNILNKRHLISRSALVASLCGTIGESAARDLIAYVEVSDKLPSWEEVIRDPKNARVPTNAAALCIMAYGAVQKIDRGNIGAWFEYLKRTPKELQSVFCVTTSKNDEKKNILMTSSAFINWMRENQYLF
jgi:hypothetical protein